MLETTQFEHFEYILAYLLIIGSSVDYVVHQSGEQFLYFMYTSSICTIRGRTIYGLSSNFGLFGPFSSYRVYNVEGAKFVCAGCLLEVNE